MNWQASLLRWTCRRTLINLAPLEACLQQGIAVDLLCPAVDWPVAYALLEPWSDRQAVRSGATLSKVDAHFFPQHPQPLLYWHLFAENTAGVWEFAGDYVALLLLEAQLLHVPRNSWGWGGKIFLMGGDLVRVEETQRIEWPQMEASLRRELSVLATPH